MIQDITGQSGQAGQAANGGTLEAVLGLGFNGEIGDQLEAVMAPLADSLSDTFIGAIRRLLEDDETADAAAGLFDGAVDGAVDVFGDDLSDLFVRAAKEGVGAFKDLDDVFANAAGVLLKNIGAALPGGLGKTLLGGAQGYQQFGAKVVTDFAGGIRGEEGSGVGFDLAQGLLSGDFGSFVKPNADFAALGADLAGSDIGKFLGLDGSADFLSDTFGQFNATGMLAGFAGSTLAGLAGFEGSGNALIDSGFGLAGNVGGAALGTALTPVLGAVAGPLGIAIGAFAGQALASAFADEDYPFAQAKIGIVNGELGLLSSRALDGGPLGQVNELGEQVAARFDVLLGTLGGRLDGAEGQELTSIGFASGRTNKLGKGYFAGAGASFAGGADFKKLEGDDVLVAGLLTALQEGVRTGAITGLSDTLLTAIPNIDSAKFEEVDGLLQFANSFDATVRAFTQGIGDPQQTASGQVAAQIAQVINQIEEFRDNTIKLGLPLDKANEAMKGFAETSLGFGDVALAQVSEVELELRRIAELRTLTDTELGILGLSRPELDAGLIERRARFTEGFLAPFAGFAAEQADPGIGERTKLIGEYNQVIADARLLGVESFDDINAYFANAFRTLFETINSAALSEAERAEETFSRLGESLQEAYEALYFGDSGVGTAEERLGLLRGRFDEIAGLALGGDEEALGELGGAAKELIEASQEVYADGIQTAATLSFVQDVLEQAIGLSAVEAAGAAASIAALSVAELSDGEIFAKAETPFAIASEGAAIDVIDSFGLEVPVATARSAAPSPVAAPMAEEIPGLLERLFSATSRLGDTAHDQRVEMTALLEEMVDEQKRLGASLNG